jgi:hypothetical protein
VRMCEPSYLSHPAWNSAHEIKGYGVSFAL